MMHQQYSSTAVFHSVAVRAEGSHCVDSGVKMHIIRFLGFTVSTSTHPVKTYTCTHTCM